MKVSHAHQNVRLSFSSTKHPFHVVQVFPVSIEMLKVPRDGNVVVGDNHTAFATDGLNVVSFDVVSLTQNWSYTSSGGALSFKNATPNRGLLIDDNASGAIQLDSTGSASTAVSGLMGIVPISISNWAGISSGELAEYRYSDGSGGLSNQLPGSPSPMPGSNANGQRGSSPCFTSTINCVIVPAYESPVSGEPTTRRIFYAFYFLDFSGGLRTLTPQYTRVQRQAFNLELRESFRNPPGNLTSSNATICAPSCGPDGFNFVADRINNNQNFSNSLLSVYQTFYVNRQQVQVFWPQRQGATTQWFGSPKTSQLGFEPPNQNQQVTTPYATHGVVQQLGVDSQNPASCQSAAMYLDSSFGGGCSMMTPGP
jgi:hypothetical protein